MQIIVKGLKGFKVFKETEDYINKKFCKFCKMVKEPTSLEFTLEHSHSSKQTIDKVIKLTARMPNLKNPEHMEETATHFNESVDILQKRFATFLSRFKDKKITKTQRVKR